VERLFPAMLSSSYRECGLEGQRQHWCKNSVSFEDSGTGYSPVPFQALSQCSHACYYHTRPILMPPSAY
jgi:hypothetical protein